MNLCALDKHMPALSAWIKGEGRKKRGKWKNSVAIYRIERGRRSLDDLRHGRERVEPWTEARKEFGAPNGSSAVCMKRSLSALANRLVGYGLVNVMAFPSIPARCFYLCFIPRCLCQTASRHARQILVQSRRWPRAGGQTLRSISLNFKTRPFVERHAICGEDARSGTCSDIAL